MLAPQPPQVDPTVLCRSPGSARVSSTLSSLAPSSSLLYRSRLALLSWEHRHGLGNPRRQTLPERRRGAFTSLYVPTWLRIRVARSDISLRQPGTALLDDKKATNYDQNVVEALKKGTGRSSHVVLVPQPSDDPNDPLNWPAWLREANFWVLTFVAGIVGGVGPALAP